MLLQKRHVVEQYFSDLESGDFRGAAAHFTHDAFYSRPPFPEEGANAPRHETIGRDALLEVFNKRGVRNARHEIQCVASSGDQFFVRGIVQDGGETLMSFIGSGRLDPATGLIADYAAYVSVPPVGQRPDPML